MRGCADHRVACLQRVNMLPRGPCNHQVLSSCEATSLQTSLQLPPPFFLWHVICCCGPLVDPHVVRTSRTVHPSPVATGLFTDPHVVHGTSPAHLAQPLPEAALRGFPTQ